jgi:hypothetical protein
MNILSYRKLKSMERNNMFPSIPNVNQGFVNQGFVNHPYSDSGPSHPLDTNRYGYKPELTPLRIGSPRAGSRRVVCSCGSEYGGKCVCVGKKLTPSNSVNSLIRDISKPDLNCPDYNPDSSLIKIGNFHDSAVNLALYTLKITKQEYASMSMEDLRRYPNTHPNGYAIDILIEDKKTSLEVGSIFPKTISPIKRSSPLHNEIKINQFTDELDNLVVQGYRK